MLDFAKKVLLNVSFDKDLFQKELIKVTKLLGKKELVALYTWCLLNYGETYKEVITQVFSEDNILI